MPTIQPSNHPTTASHKLELGRQLYRRFTTIFVLRSQHQYSVQQTAGACLLDLARCFTDPKVFSRQDGHAVRRALNSRAITSIDPFLNANRHVVILRHTAEVPINRHLFYVSRCYTDCVRTQSRRQQHFPRKTTSKPAPTSNFPADKTGHFNTVQFYSMTWSMSFSTTIGLISAVCGTSAASLEEPPIPANKAVYQLSFTPQVILTSRSHI
jgi:hypothetical protein